MSYHRSIVPLGRRLRRTALPRGGFAPLAFAALASQLLSSCPTGLGHGPSDAQPTQAEAAPTGVEALGLSLGISLVDAGSNTPTTTQDAQALAVAVPDFGSVVFYAYATTARADDADGVGTPLDPTATSDSNDVEDVFLTAVDTSGAVIDTVLVSRRNPTADPIQLIAGDAASVRPRIAHAANPNYGADPLVDPENSNLAGRVYVVFESDATDLVAGDANGQRDVFQAVVYLRTDEDPATGQPAPGKLNLRTAPDDVTSRFLPKYEIQLVSSSVLGWNGGNGGSRVASLAVVDSQDGNADPRDVLWFAFESDATDIVWGFTPPSVPATQVFVSILPPPRTTTHDAGHSCTDCHGPPSYDPGCGHCHSYGDRYAFLVSASGGIGSTGGDGGSHRPTLVVEPSGSWAVAFESDASDLVAGDDNLQRDVFYQSSAWSLGRASVASGGGQASGGSSRNAVVYPLDAANGELLIAFESSSADIVPELPPLTSTSVFLHDTRDTSTVLLNQHVGPAGSTLGTAQGGSAPADSYAPSFGRSGRSISFSTLADNLDVFRPHDDNEAEDVVVVDLDQLANSGHLRHRRVSISPAGKDADGPSTAGAFGAFEGSVGVALATNGQPLAFSEALAPKFLHPRCTTCHGWNGSPSTRPASHTATSGCTDCHTPELTGVADWKAPDASFDFRNKSMAELYARAMDPEPPLTPEGHLKDDDRIQWALTSGAIPDNGPGNGQPRDTVPGGQAEWDAQVDAWVEGNYQSQDLGASGGDFVSFTTAATNLTGSVPTRQVVAFLREAKVERVSKRSGWAPGGGAQVEGRSRNASITRDDRYVAFETEAAISPKDDNGKLDVYVRDTFLGTTILISHAAGSSSAANGASARPSIALDPSTGEVFVAFESTASNLVSGFADRNGASATDVFVASLSGFDGAHSSTIAIELVSGASSSATEGSGSRSSNASIDANASMRYVAFESLGTDVTSVATTDANGASAADVFLWTRDGSSTVTALLSTKHDDATLGGGRESRAPHVDAESTVSIAFESEAHDLVNGFTQHNADDEADVFVATATGTVSLVSGTSSTDGADGESTDPCIATPSFIAFASTASNLLGTGVFSDHNGPAPDVYLRDELAATIELVSRTPASAVDGGNGGSYRPQVSLDGNLIAFDSLATDLIVSDSNGASDVFLRDRANAATLRLSRSSANSQASGGSSNASLGSNAGRAAFESTAEDLLGASVDTNGKSDVFRAAR